MKYLSIDTETTGLNPETCQILSFAAVLEDTSKPEVAVEDLPHIHIIFDLPFIKGEPYALNLNKELIRIIKEGKDSRLVSEDSFDSFFKEFLFVNKVEGRLKVAGKNFSSFDLRFLERIMCYTGVFSVSKEKSDIKYHHKVLDVGSVFVDFKNDEWLPDLNECMNRAGVLGSVQHDALEDARDVVRTLRARY